MVGDGPVIDLSQVVFIDEFGEGLAPVVPYLVGGGCATGDEFGKMREEIVAAALLKFGGEVGSPVGSVGFEGVGEDGVGWGVAEGFDEWFAYFFEMSGYGLMAERIEDVAFGSYCGSLDLLFGVAGDEEEGDARFVGWGNVAAGGWDGFCRGGIPSDLGWGVAILDDDVRRGRGAADVAVGEATVLRCADGKQVGDGGGDDGVAFFKGGRNGDESMRCDGNFDGAKAACGFCECGGGAAVRPAAAESDVDAETEFASFVLGEVDGVEHGGREEGKVDEILCRVVEDLRVDEGEFGATDAVGLHLLELAEDLGFFHCRAEPPPTDHGFGVGWGTLEVCYEGLCGSLCK